MLTREVYIVHVQNHKIHPSEYMTHDHPTFLSEFSTTIPNSGLLCPGPTSTPNHPGPTLKYYTKNQNQITKNP